MGGECPPKGREAPSPLEDMPHNKTGKRGSRSMSTISKSYGACILWNSAGFIIKKRHACEKRKSELLGIGISIACIKENTPFFFKQVAVSMQPNTRFFFFIGLIFLSKLKANFRSRILESQTLQIKQHGFCINQFTLKNENQKSKNLLFIIGKNGGFLPPKECLKTLILREKLALLMQIFTDTTCL